MDGSIATECHNEQTPLIHSHKGNVERTPLPKLQIGIILFLQISEPLCSMSIYPYINEVRFGRSFTLAFFFFLIYNKPTPPAGIPVLCHGGSHSISMESNIRSYRQKTCSIDWVARDISVDAVVWTFSYVLDTSHQVCYLHYTWRVIDSCHLQSLSVWTSKWKHRLQLPSLVFVLHSLFFSLDRCYEKFHGRTHGSDKSSRSICIDACYMGIWSIYRVSKEFVPSQSYFYWHLLSIRPLLGGSLARPSDHFPTIFTGGFWRQYPYYLPCLAAGIFVLLALIIVAAFFQEVGFAFICTGFISFANIPCPFVVVIGQADVSNYEL